MNKFGKFVCIILFIIFSILGIYYQLTIPSNDLNWKYETNRTAYAKVDGSQVTFYNLRNASYTEEGLANLSYYNQSYNADEIKAIWMFVQPFAKWDRVAHTMVSFEFENGEFLLLSIEARQEVGENYGALTGIFNQFETIYVWGTEYDMITRRMLWLGDPLRMYRVESSPEFRKSFFLSLVEETNSLVTTPQFYNTWTSSCTSTFVKHINAVDPNVFGLWEHEFHFPGVVDRLFLKKGIIAFDGTYDQLRSAHTIYPQDVNMSYENFSHNLRS